MNLPSITCQSCHEHAEAAIAEVQKIMAHHNLKVDLRLVGDATLADQCIHHIDRAAQEAL